MVVTTLLYYLEKKIDGFIKGEIEEDQENKKYYYQEK